ncbi:MAG: ParB/RepB/Spo0J family partition protein [Sphingomonadaceae bacterium]|nr:ParB/RepB/Spo0J family partition protein [Sphingomonadaceae bacterium]
MSEGEAAARRKPMALGRGLNALLGDATPEAAQGAGVNEIAVGSIVRNEHQPRKHFDEEALDELARSITAHGVLQPIIVRDIGGDKYEIIAGERRWRAAQRAQLHAIPAIVREVPLDKYVLELAILENIQRADLNPVEEAAAYARLINVHLYTQADLARVVHKSRSHVTNIMRLLELDTPIREMVADGRLTMGHARALIGVPDAEMIAERVIRDGLSVRDVERIAKAKKRPSQVSTAPSANADIAMLERQLGDLTGLKVAIRHDGAAGTVTLHYATLDQLDMICQRLSGEKI